MVLFKAISSVEERSKSVTKCNTVLKSIPLLFTYNKDDTVLFRVVQLCTYKIYVDYDTIVFYLSYSPKCVMLMPVL